MSDKAQISARVLVTRPAAQSERLATLIEAAGGVALRAPALIIEATLNPEDAQARFSQLDDYHALIFISPNAVNFALDYFQPEQLDQQLCLAIGASTARAMEQASLPCHAHPERNYTSEALLGISELQDVVDKTLLIVRGNGGRSLLGDELTARGANVHYAEVYRRDIPKQSAQILNQCLADDQAEILLASSVETLNNIVSMCDERWHPRLFQLQLLTGSARVAQCADELGFAHSAIIASGPDDSALMQALRDWTTTVDNAGDTHLPEEISMTEQNSHDKPQLHDDQDAPAIDAPDRPDLEEQQGDTTAGANNNSSVSEDAVSVAPAEPVKVKRSGGGIAWLALLTALGAGGGAAWTWWQQHNAVDPVTEVAELDIPSREEIQDEIKQLSSVSGSELSARVDRKIDRQAQQIEEALDKQSDLASDVRKQARSVENLTDELTQMEDSLSAMRGVSANVRNTWVRAETEYFLQTANTRLQLASDVPSAISALKAADERIIALGDPSLTPVRAQLSEDLLALESLPKIDIEGISLTLSSLASKVTDLPLANALPDNYEYDGSKVVAKEDGAWSRTKSALSEMAGALIEVTPTADSTVALLAPDQAYFLYRNLELQLQSARLLALQGRDTLYKDSLNSSSEWLTRYFDQNHPGVQVFGERLAELAKQPVSHTLPDISGSLSLIRNKVPAARSSTPPIPAPEQPTSQTLPTPVDAPENGSAGAPATTTDSARTNTAQDGVTNGSQS